MIPDSSKSNSNLNENEEQKSEKEKKDFFPPPSQSTSAILSSCSGGLIFEEPKIHNIVSTANFNCKLDLSKIVTRLRNAEYNPKRFRAVIIRIFEPRTTAMLFASGKIVCTGAKNERLSCLACRKYCRMIQKIGYDIKFSEFKVRNIVSTLDVKFPICLDKMAISHQQFCSYDPDYFPALVYRLMCPTTVLLIFVSGKIIITGAKSREDMVQTIYHILPVLQSFRKY